VEHDSEVRLRTFVQNVLDRWIGTYVKTEHKFGDVWQDTKISDLWRTNLNISYKSSRYTSQFSILD
jgi:hypothetical protein